METKGILTAIHQTRKALSTQMKRLQLVSENIAHADRVVDANAPVYRRQTVVMKGDDELDKIGFGRQLSLTMRRSNGSHMKQHLEYPGGASGIERGPYFEVVEEENTTKLVYNPKHPNADASGYVRMYDINLVEEMVDMMSASRVYEANVTVMNAAKHIAKRSMEL